MRFSKERYADGWKFVQFRVLQFDIPQHIETIQKAFVAGILKGYFLGEIGKVPKYSNQFPEEETNMLLYEGLQADPGNPTRLIDREVQNRFRDDCRAILSIHKALKLGIIPIAARRVFPGDRPIEDVYFKSVNLETLGLFQPADKWENLIRKAFLEAKTIYKKVQKIDTARGKERKVPEFLDDGSLLASEDFQGVFAEMAKPERIPLKIVQNFLHRNQCPKKFTQDEVKRITMAR